MKKYKDLYQWMVIPMILMQFGIFEDYWGDLSDNAWSVHVHYWTGTVWYLYLIIQPYYATHGRLDQHRTNGIIGMFLAGGVCITALSMFHREIATTQRAMQAPDTFGPFEPWFFLGVIAIETPMIIAFGFAVVKSILNRKNLEDHAWWLISTVFIIMMPALGRGILNTYVGMNINHWPDINIMVPLYATQLVIIGLTLLTAWKYGKLRHPATYLAVGVNVYVCFLEPIGKWEVVQTFLKTAIK